MSSFSRLTPDPQPGGGVLRQSGSTTKFNGSIARGRDDPAGFTPTVPSADTAASGSVQALIASHPPCEPPAALTEQTACEVWDLDLC